MNSIDIYSDSRKKQDKEYRDAYLVGTFILPVGVYTVMYLLIKSPWLTTSKVPGFLMVASGFLSSVVACHYWVRLKGLAPRFLLLGLLPVLGWLVLAFLPDKRAKS
jgi:hypothetical protein